MRPVVWRSARRWRCYLGPYDSAALIESLPSTARRIRLRARESVTSANSLDRLRVEQ
jgi:hypothetical protein